MKRIVFALIFITILFCSCESTDTVEESSSAVLPEQKAEIVVETTPSETLYEEPEPVSAPIEVESPLVSEEYLRSVGNLSGDDKVIVPPDVFEDDKNQIFQIIDDLDRIMKKKDFNSWYNYLTPDSQEYWSNKHNLNELALHLFASNDFKFNNIREYFEYFFIPARRGRIVDEIRYVTPDYVKVVQYKNDTDIIYYFFEKQDGSWKLHLDTL